jgi:branched-chain amino acid transport system substrate-binding protein
MRRTASTIAAIVVLAVLTACSGTAGAGSSSAARSGGTLQVGMIDSLTGAVSQAGTADVCGAKIAVKAIDAGMTAGTGGWKVDLQIEDDQSNPSTAAAAASKLTSAGRQIFVGGAASTSVLATLPIIDDAGGLHTGGTSKAEEFLSGGKLLVRVNSDVSSDAKAVSKLVEGFSPKSVDLVAVNSAYGQGAEQGVKANLDPSIRLKTISVEATQSNFDAIVSTINQDDPDVVLFALVGNAGISFMRAAANVGLTAKVVSYAGTLVGSYLEPSGGATDGVYGLDTYESFLDNKANKTFVAAFDKYGPPIAECKGIVPDHQSGITYSQVLLVAQAANKSRSSDPAKLHATMLAGAWQLPPGTIRFGTNGQAIARYITIVGKEVGGKPSLVEYKG